MGVGALAVALVAGVAVFTVFASASPANRQLDQARRATAQYHRVAVAESRGYGLPAEGPLSQCIEAIDAPGTMGYHYINGTEVGDAVLTPRRPEALVYEKRRNGLRLVAVEYVVFADAWQQAHGDKVPRLFGRKLTLVEAPNRYELPAFWQIHVWLWKYNPTGLFADFNPRAGCGPSGL